MSNLTYSNQFSELKIMACLKNNHTQHLLDMKYTRLELRYTSLSASLNIILYGQTTEWRHTSMQFKVDTRHWVELSGLLQGPRA